MRKLFFSVVVLFLVCKMQAQEPSLPQIAPPTPEIAALGKFLDIPVNHSTGTPNISIPITSISEGKLSASVSLSYHASGIRVNEIASRTGLGWSLIAGGMVSRQVRGIPDDEQEGYINTSNTVDHYYSQDQNTRTTLFQNAISGYQDYESDMYSFNVAGQGGKFFFDQNGNIIDHLKSDFKIVPLRDGITITGWEITNPTGITYTFGVISGTSTKVHEVKQTRFYTAHSQLPSRINHNITGWYLTRISDAFGNKLDFNYTQGTTNIEFWNITGQSKNIMGNGQGCSDPRALSTFLSQDIYKPTYLSSIVSSNGRIEFTYNLNRSDLKNDKALTGVKLFDNTNDLKIHYDLTYDYFISPNGWEVLGSYGDIDQRTKRLYLKNIQQKKGSLTNQTYTFSYNQNHILPDRFSFSQDFWGYFNGRTNTVLYPETAYRPFGNPVEVPGADRKVSLAYAKALILTEIKYPTGGKTKFNFESNTVYGINEDFFIGNKIVDEVIPNSQLANDANQPGATFSTSFTLSEFTTLYFSVRADYKCNHAANDCPTIELRKSDGSIVTTFQTEKWYEDIRDLQAGTYVLNIINGLLQTDNNVSVVAYKKTLQQIDTGTAQALTGGLRVNEIQYLDADYTLINTKKYNYKLFDDPDKSSGYSMNPPVFLSQNVEVGGSSGSCSLDMISSNAIFPLNGQSGSYVNYINVTEYNQNEENGKTEYTYSYAPDGAVTSGNSFSGEGYLGTPAVDYSHRRGQLIKKGVFKYSEASATFDLVQEDINTYTPQENIRIKNIKMGNIGSYNEAHSYDNLSERYLLTQKRKINYEDSGAITTTTQYVYDTGYYGRTFATAVTTTNSDGLTTEQKSYYPDDVTSTTALGEPISTYEYTAINNLKKNAQHRIAEPVQVEVYVNGNLTTSQRTNYDSFLSNTVPKNIAVSKDNQSFDERISYHKYDTKGNPLEVSKTDGGSITYIWSYNQMYPVAKIENATFSEVATALGMTEAALMDFDESSISSLDGLRTSLPNAMVSTYGYEPLVGITKMTDPRGYTMTYHYDEFNRLQFIKDEEGNLISENKYNYRTE